MKKKWVLFTSIVLNFAFVVLLICGAHNIYKNENDAYALDLLYNQEIKKAASNFEKCEINNKYSDLWYEKITLYNNALISYYSEDEEMQNKINLSHYNWLEFKDIQEDIYFDFLKSVYTTGSIVPIIQSAKRCELNRERAIYLHQQCEMLFLEVEKL